MYGHDCIEFRRDPAEIVLSRGPEFARGPNMTLCVLNLRAGDLWTGGTGNCIMAASSYCPGHMKLTLTRNGAGSCWRRIAGSMSVSISIGLIVASGQSGTARHITSVWSSASTEGSWVT